MLRRGKVIALLARYPSYERGSRAKIARELGVSRSTITRDLQALDRLWQQQQAQRGPSVSIWDGEAAASDGVTG